VPEQPKSIPQVVTELKELTVAYAKQETLDPLKQLGRFAGYGLAGVMLLAIGLVLLGLAGLRFLQTETGDVLDGSLSWAPYVIETCVLGALAVAAVFAIRRRGFR
jgi:hypothetical protein